VFSKIGTRNAMVIAVASFALDLDPSGRVGAAIGSAGPTVLRAPEAEAFLAAAVAADAVDDAVAARFGELCSAAARPIDDVRGSAVYRRHAVGVMARRAVSWAMAELAEAAA
jgi:CO/xanthine dehydrogenase FAD-binding subunit